MKTKKQLVVIIASILLTGIIAAVLDIIFYINDKTIYFALGSLNIYTTMFVMSVRRGND